MKKKLNIVMLSLVIAIIGCSDTTQTSDAYINYSNLIIVEDDANDGTFLGSIEVEAVGVEFSETLVLNEDYEFLNAPEGITMSITRVDANNATVEVGGQVAGHGRCDFQSAGLTFLNSAFSNGNRPENANVLFGLAFRPATITTNNGTYVEAATAGTVDNSDPATLTLGGAGYFAFLGQLTRGTHYILSKVGTSEEDDSAIAEGLIETLTVLPDLQTLEVTFDGLAQENLAEHSFAFSINFLDTNVEDPEEITLSPFLENTFCIGQTPSLNIAVTFVD